jgi:hypothetical protein
MQWRLAEDGHSEEMGTPGLNIRLSDAGHRRGVVDSNCRHTQAKRVSPSRKSKKKKSNTGGERGKADLISLLAEGKK